VRRDLLHIARRRRYRGGNPGALLEAAHESKPGELRCALQLLDDVAVSA